jgi:hypothetical protein
MRRALFAASLTMMCVLAVVCGIPRAHADDWQPVSKEDLKLTSAQAGGAAAIILYHEVNADDVRKHHIEYRRIKILTDKGKRFADVEIPYSSQGRFNTQIVDVKARTIRPDGSIVPFSGEVFDKTVVKARGIKIKVKAFTFPDVQVGSIVEWRYTKIWSDEYVVAARWVLQEELAQKRAKFSYTPLDVGGNHLVEIGHGSMADGIFHVEIGLPKGVGLKNMPGGRIELEMNDIPAYVPEEFSPPAETMKMRVLFYYGNRKMLKPEEFWRNQGKYWTADVEKFMGRSSAVAQAAQQAVNAGDTPEQKVRKIYAVVQRMNNQSYRERSTLEALQEQGEKRASSAEQVLAEKKGTRDELARLFLAMARALQIPAYLMRVASREETFFQPAIPEWSQLDSEIVIVTLGDKEVFLDPGTPMCPFGLLDWKRTGVQGVRQTSGSTTELAQTPSPQYTEAVTNRVAELKLEPDGSAKGRITLVWTGQEALQRRLEGLQTDEAGRKKAAEDELRALLPEQAVVKLESLGAWDEGDQPLRARFDVEIPALAGVTGKRLLLPSGIFETRSRQQLIHTDRKTPVYFEYPRRVVDRAVITLPSGVQVENLPYSAPAETDFALCRVQRTARGQTLDFQRDFAINGFAFAVAEYPVVKAFFEKLHSNDDEQVVLRIASAAATN